MSSDCSWQAKFHLSPQTVNLRAALQDSLTMKSTSQARSVSQGPHTAGSAGAHIWAVCSGIVRHVTSGSKAILACVDMRKAWSIGP